jgi:hypothetical protein
MKLHVFVNSEGAILASGPAPVLPGKVPVTGPIFAGFSPVGSSQGIQGYELDVADDVLATARDSGTDEFVARLTEIIRTGQNLKPIDVLR